MTHGRKNMLRQAYDDGRHVSLRHVFVKGLDAVLGRDRANEIRSAILRWVKDNPEPPADAVLSGWWDDLR